MIITHKEVIASLIKDRRKEASLRFTFLSIALAFIYICLLIAAHTGLSYLILLPAILLIPFFILSLWLAGSVTSHDHLKASIVVSISELRQKLAEEKEEANDAEEVFKNEN